MRKALFVLSILAVFSVAANAADTKEGGPVSADRYKRYMHEIFKNYRNVTISIEMRDYELTNIHLKHLLANMEQIPGLFKDLEADGIKIDPEAFQKRLETLRKSVAALREALKTKNHDKIKKAPVDVFNSCLGCHKEARLKWMFRMPMTSSNVFVEYMHEISDNMRQVGNFLFEGDAVEAGDYLRIADQYLFLLKNMDRFEGPSGVVLDKKRLLNEIKDAEGIGLLLLEDIKEKNSADIEPMKKHLNTVCVSCHKPLMIP
ncbi:MAG: cytochrome c [Nitrospinae bacterium]|nr:cytochrome c [Nitrospinota bacterium]